MKLLFPWGNAGANRKSPHDASWAMLSQMFGSQTPATDQETSRVLAYPCHWPGYLQSTCTPLSLARMLVGYLHTPDTDQDTCRVPAYS